MAICVAMARNRRQNEERRPCRNPRGSRQTAPTSEERPARNVKASAGEVGSPEAAPGDHRFIQTDLVALPMRA
eukprot:8219966-Pyramimonas_sp.AAC.1